MMKKIKLDIRTLSPVVLPMSGGSAVLTPTLDGFSGTLVRGILVQRFLERKPLDAPEQDATFRSLFFGNMSYTTAYPVQDGKIAMPLPRSLQKEKDGSKLLDLLYSGKRSDPGYKSCKGIGVIEDGIMSPVTIRKTIRLHMSRNNATRAKSVREEAKLNERLAGRSQRGGIYNYEAIDAGQSFSGYIVGPAEKLAALLDILGDRTFTAQAGRSRYTQYGSVRITLSEPERLPAIAASAVDQDQNVGIRLTAPLIPLSRNLTSAKEGLAVIADEMNRSSGSDAFSIVADRQKVFAAVETLQGFVGIWGLPRPNDTAISAGSVCCLHKEGAPWTDDDFTRLVELGWQGIGARKQEGFGQFRLYHKQDMTYQPAEAERSTAVPPRRLVDPIIRDRAAIILKKYLTAQVKGFAIEDARQASKDMQANFTHILNQLDDLLYMKRGSFHMFREALLAEVSDKNENTPLRKKLRNINMTDAAGRHTTLGELLLESGEDKFPYFSAERRRTIESNGLADAASDIGIALEALWRDKDVCYGYWHTFLRISRKYAKQDHGEVDAHEG